MPMTRDDAAIRLRRRKRALREEDKAKDRRIRAMELERDEALGFRT